MSNAYDLLNTLAATETSTDRTLVVDHRTRTIMIPDAVTNLGVENDDDALRLDFKIPRYLGDTDLSAFSIRINYVNADGEEDIYTVNNPVIGANDITFSWLVGPIATACRGNTKFNICMRTFAADGTTVEREYNTTPATLPVLEGLETDEGYIDSYADILEQWRRELFGIGDTEEANILAVSQAEQTAIENKGAEVLATIPAEYTETAEAAQEGLRTKADAIVCEAQGEKILISDSSDDRVRGLKIFGKTTQLTTTGKNLLNAQEKFELSNIFNIPVSIPAGTYVVSLKKETHSGDQPPYLRFYDNAVWILLKNGLSQTVTLSEPETNVYLYTYGMSAAESNGVTATFEQLMVSVDGGAYEPYSGGVASPSPEWPQDLINMCNDETIDVAIYGKNLMDFVGILGDNYTVTADGLTATVKDGFANVTGTNTNTGFNNIIHAKTIPTDKKIILPAGTYTTHPRLRVSAAGKVTNTWANLCGTFTFAEPFTITGFYIAYGAGETVNESVPLMMIAGTGVPTVYEECKPKQNVSVSVSNNLPGILVKSGGYYRRMDSNGNKWICDEIDFERGIYIQRIKDIVCTGNESWADSSTYPAYSLMLERQAATGLCTHMNRLTVTELRNGNQGVYLEWSGYALVQLKEYFPTLAEFKAFLVEQYANGTPVTFRYAFETPIETPLTAEEIEWFKAAHTNFPNTTVLNDASAEMELKYNADTKTWVENRPKVSDEQVQIAVDAYLEENPVESVSDEHINSLIDAKLGVIENGTY